VSTFNGLTDLIEDGSNIDNPNRVSASKAGDVKDCSTVQEEQPEIKIPKNVGKPFDVQEFCEEVRKKSEDDNRIYNYYAENISGYSIAAECIGTTVAKILNYPVESFSHKWLPIVMRASIGKAVHDAIQENTLQFTEQERSMKVPSIRTSVRLDGLISNNVLVEIKSCTYSDYRKILKDQTPRIADFYQVMMYKYILENHLDECKKQKKVRTLPPQLDEYNIDTLQFIYVAHDVISSDAESFSECMKIVKNVKQLLKSKYNQFFFITSLVLDVNQFDTTPYMDFIKKKIERINWYIEHNKFPTKDDEFVDTSKCYFCLYSDNCSIKN